MNINKMIYNIIYYNNKIIYIWSDRMQMGWDWIYVRCDWIQIRWGRIYIRYDWIKIRWYWL